MVIVQFYILYFRASANTTSTYPPLTSNPVVTFDGYSKGVVVFAQASDGQV